MNRIKLCVFFGVTVIALGILVGFLSRPSLEELSRRASGQDATKAIRAIRSLSRRQDPGSVEALERATRNPNTLVATEATLVLIHMGTSTRQAVVSELETRIRSPCDSEVEVAVRVIGYAELWELSADLTSMIARRDDDEVAVAYLDTCQAAALSALKQIGGAAVPGIIERLDEADLERGKIIGNVLGGIAASDVRVERLLRQSLQDATSVRRRDALEHALGRIVVLRSMR